MDCNNITSQILRKNATAYGMLGWDEHNETYRKCMKCRSDDMEYNYL